MQGSEQLAQFVDAGHKNQGGGDCVQSPVVKDMSVQQLFDFATDDKNSRGARIRAQDELSRRAYYEEDAEARRALAPEIPA